MFNLLHQTILLLLAFITADAQSLCRMVVCPLGEVCNANTGTCIWSKKASDMNLCAGKQCPGGTHCEATTGSCLPIIRTIYNRIPCSNVICPAGQICDPSRNQCVNYKLQYLNTSKRSKSLRYFQNMAPLSTAPIPITCHNFSCPSGYQCNIFTGRCMPYRSLDSDLCMHVHCPEGYQCNMASGVCSRVQTIQSDKCYGVDCPIGTTCDITTGNCVAFHLSNTGMDLCVGTSCPNSACDSTTGACIPPSTHIEPDHTRNLCLNVNCPFGVCDAQTGRCAQYKWTQVQPPSASPKLPCNGNICIPGTTCDDNTRDCVQYRPQSSRILTAKKYLCIDVKCPQGTTCDSNSGLCRQFRPAQTKITTDLCAYVQCPYGYQCNPKNGVCAQNRPIRRMLAEPVSCPLHSHYVQCGSPCPYTCNNIRRTCSNPCINTCQCDDTFVQVSLTNVTCVPAEQCKIYGGDLCTTLKCPDSMVCVDGYCNPVNCPHLIKPDLPRGCAYDLNRDERNCLVFDIVC